MILKTLDSEFSICKVGKYTHEMFSHDFVFVGKTDEENSVVLPTEFAPVDAIEREDGFVGFRIVGVLDFTLCGILSRISSILAEIKVGIFAVSTFNTDYVFVKKEQFALAKSALTKNGYEFE